MMVQSVSGLSELANISFQGSRGRFLEINHPFVSANAWIRAIPETGSTYIGAYRADEANPQVISTYQRGSYLRIQNYQKGIGVYRNLSPGELEGSSGGFAQWYLSRRPKIETRGGLITRWADQDKMISGDRSPTHVKELFQNRSNDIQDAVRVGIVSRPAKNITGALSTWELSYPKIRGSFAAEYFIDLKNPAKSNPATLLRVQKGHVLDISGQQIRQGRTQIPLRSSEIYYANDDSSTVQEVDEKGNVFIQTATAATEGYELSVPSGNYIKSIEKDETVTVGGDLGRSIKKNGNYIYGENYTLTAGQDLLLKSERGSSALNFVSTVGKEQVVLKSKGHFLILDDTSGSEGLFLIHKTGSQFVIDKDGSAKWVTKSGNTVFLDDPGGSILATSKSGAFVNVSDSITLGDKTGKQLVTLDGTDTIQIVSAKNVLVNSEAVSIVGGSINLGSNAVFSSVIGEQLALLFDTHTHGSVMGPTTPPLPPTTAAVVNANPATSFLSAYVKTRGNLA